VPQLQQLADDVKSGCWIVPVWGWYNTAFDTDSLDKRDSSKSASQQKADALLNLGELEGWSDFRMCVFGGVQKHHDQLRPWLSALKVKPFKTPKLSSDVTAAIRKLAVADAMLATDGVANYFHALAEIHLLSLASRIRASALGPGGGCKVLTFSHFLPRPELLPARNHILLKQLIKVCGHSELDRLVRSIGSSVHLFGHTHISRDMTVQDVRYIQNPRGYPREYWLADVKLMCLHEVASRN